MAKASQRPRWPTTLCARGHGGVSRLAQPTSPHPSGVNASYGKEAPSLKAKRLSATLERKPLGYCVARQAGSHRRLEAPDRPPLTFAFHDNATIPPASCARSSSVVKLTEGGIPFALGHEANLEHFVPADERIPA
jgi:predicted RNA binding protein YcfA (HicA-like mRNA interferase family)